jgi:chromate reductase
MRVLGVSGSLRSDSYNRRLLLEAAELLPPGAELDVFDGLKEIPPYDEDDDVEDGHPAVAHWRAAVAGTDAVLFATPEYNGSIPGQLKNAVDWASRPHGRGALFGKPTAVIGASTGAFGAVWAQADLRRVLGHAGARVVDGEASVPHAHRRLAEHGHVVNDELGPRLSLLLDALVAEATPLVAAA